MGLFNRKKNAEETKECCCGCCEPAAAKQEAPKDARFKILGGGCPKCNALEAALKAALQKRGMDEPIEHVTDYSEIAKFGVMSTPALVIGGKVVSMGKVLKAEEIGKLLEANPAD
jgi:small redox-active disulfide protein 2